MIKFRLFGVRIEVSFLYLSLIAGLSIYDKTGIVIWGLFSSLFHEVFHLIVLYIFGIRPEYIAFELSGIRIVKKSLCSPFKDIMVLISGCIGNLILFLICLKFGWMTGATVNIFMCVFNLLPSMVLDGGQMLYTIFGCFFSCRISLMICKTISMIVSFVLLTIGVIIFIYYKNPTMLFTGAMLICYSFFNDC